MRRYLGLRRQSQLINAAAAIPCGAEDKRIGLHHECDLKIK
jgi:hypothetical protein